MKTNCNHRHVLILVFLMLNIVLCAQNQVRIHYTDGSTTDIPINQIDSITFVKGDSETVVETELAGSWLWGQAEAGYYELLTFHNDHAYEGYDNYFMYGYHSTTYGWYSQQGTLLFLQSNGFGYFTRYTWFLMGLSGNALDVMTKMGRFTYYRVQPDVIRMRVGDSLSCNAGEAFVFTDGVTVSTTDAGLLQALSSGTTYILKRSQPSALILAYKVIVE